MNIKPILFNTEMVRAILDGRKTVTRRVIKLKYSNTHIEWKNDKYGKRLIELQNDVEGETYGRNPDGRTWRKLLAYRELKAPFTKGDILYVRETWTELETVDGCPFYAYKADDGRSDAVSLHETFEKWRPSIHMPKEAARIWLKVTDVSVERLQDIDTEGILREGIEFNPVNEKIIHDDFHRLWDSTIKKESLSTYGWDANPWLWVIEFERCEKPED
ncbi:MAG: hypothetical protein J6S85_10195 [Methanobrevibacter sp.]|nr:hypothetical protein [Methanobrevibacter sp.]